MISSHCFELDTVVAGTRRKGEDSFWPEKFSLFLSLEQSGTLLTLRGFVLLIGPLECATSSFSVCFTDAAIRKGYAFVSLYLIFQYLSLS